MAAARDPNEFIAKSLGKTVVIKMNNGVDYKGKLATLDG